MDTQHPNPDKPVHVLLITEGTYPFHFGGVSTWCHLLLYGLPQVNFTLMSLTAHPDLKPQFTLPPNVIDFRPIPLWGIHDAAEMRHDHGLIPFLRGKRRTTEATVKRDFIPAFRPFLFALFGGKCEPERLGQIIHQLYRFFLAHDFDATMRSRAVWECFVETAQDLFPRMAASSGYPHARFDLADLVMARNWLYHWLFPLAAPLPHVDVVHAAMVGCPTLVAAAAKLEFGAAYLLTEHGVYLRERYLAEASTTNLFGKLFSLGFARRMTELSYALADQISPCCDFNQRWERRMGADPSKLQTINYGVDATRFAPAPRVSDAAPTVVWVGRIDPLKDVLTLIKAAAFVRQNRPDVRFLLFGSAPPGNEGYYQQCLDLRTHLRLEDTVVFAGYTSDTAAAFNTGDVTVLSSISEAFPYVILEAMLCEKPVVATAVGGVPEQVEGCGLAVEPGNPKELARGILTLVNDADLRAALGRAARMKASSKYTTDKSHGAYYASYLRLARGERRSLQGGSSSVPTRGGFGEEREMAVASARVSGNGHQMALGLDLRSSTVPRVQMTSSPGMIATVVERVADRDQLPVDAFEVAALIESFGITDDMAAQRYGVTDIFALAEAVLARIRSSQEKARAALVARVMQRNVPPVNLREVMALLTSFGISDREAARRYGMPTVLELGQMIARRMRLPQHASESSRDRDLRQAWRPAMADYIRGPLALMPSIFIIFTILMYAIVGKGEPDQVLALSLGMTGGILITNGFIYAMARRCSIYLSLGRSDAAWRFLTICIVAGFVFAVGAATITFLGLARLGLLPAQAPLIFAVALGAVAMLWLLGAGLCLVEQTEWLTIALAAGLLAGAGINAVLEAYTVHHLAVATVLGFLTTVTVLIGALWWAYGQDAQPRSPRPRTVLPSAAFVIDEALPYFGYGLLYMAFVALPHVLGWAGIIQSQQNQLAVIARFELGMTAALAPFVLVGGIAERSLRLFWELMSSAQKMTPATNRERFSRLLRQQYRRQLGVYLVTLTILSLITVALFQTALGRGMLSTWVSPSDVNEVVFIFRASLIAYWLAGWGAYNGVYLVTLARAHMAAGAVALGIVVVIVAGLQSLVEYGFTYAPVAWIIGGIGFVLASSWAVGRILRSADYYFAASL